MSRFVLHGFLMLMALSTACGRWRSDAATIQAGQSSAASASDGTGQASAQADTPAEPIPVVMLYKALDEHVGEVVTLRGIVADGKIPTIIGVEVLLDDPDLRGQVAEATGRLVRFVVKEQDLAAGEKASPGPGTCFRLSAVGSDRSLASARGVHVPVITSPAEVDDHMGEIVTLRGLVTNSKIATILGVSVHSYGPDLRGEIGQATGLLIEFEIKEGTLGASPLPGTYRRLKALDSNRDASVRLAND